MSNLYLDLETYSEIPIKDGTYKYAENCEVMLFLWALDDEPVECWDLTTGSFIPPKLFIALMDKDVTITAHNSMFDRNVLRLNRNNPVEISIIRWRDTMVKAYSHGLPGSLDQLGEIFGLSQDQRKMKEGHQLVQLFCKPRAKKTELCRSTRATRETHPEEWAKFIEYGKRDVETMRALDRKIPNWNYGADQLALWHLDQAINDRGLTVDLELAKAAICAIDKAKSDLATRTQEITEGEVSSATQRDKMLARILSSYGIDLPDMTASTVERRIADDTLPAELRELLSIRLQATTSSTAKYGRLVKGLSKDGTLKGTSQFRGAARTGRWAHRLFQPGNMPRLNIDAVADWYRSPIKEVDENKIHHYLDFGIDALKHDAAHLVYDNVMALCANSIRGLIVAPKNKKLVVADLANIEGRYAAWLAGESWKLQAFRDYDAGTGPDIYKLAYAKSFKTNPDDVTRPQRQIGKVKELMLQYEGGVGAYITGAATYGIDLDALADTALPTIPADVRDEAENFYKWCLQKKISTFDLKPETFITCDSLKRLWRAAHPAISSLWGEIASFARRAILHPGATMSVPSRSGRITMRCDGTWLRIALSSGRVLCYPNPQVNASNEISYMGVNPYSRRWKRIKTYGGKLLENMVQAGSCDVLTSNMADIEAAGYEIRMTVHDELVTTAPDSDEFNVEHLCGLMTQNKFWNEGLPLAASGFEGYRYRKD